MVMRNIGRFHCPAPRFIFRDAVEGNKPGQGAMETVSRNNHTLIDLL